MSGIDKTAAATTSAQALKSQAPVVRGTLENVTLSASPEAAGPLPAGYVRVAVRAAGLNFRDVMISLGLVPQDTRGLGGEAAGVVTEVAPDVTSVRPGQRVMGLFTSTGSVALADSRLISVFPDSWSFAQAATVPIAFLTAFYALNDLANTSPGETVLIHAATGGVGLAALQVARSLGAEILATASPAKWQVLNAQGVTDPARIASSRNADFENHFRATPPNVILNCLAGDLIDASLRLLPQGGRFVEMGKTDLRDAASLAEQYPGTTYRAFDLFDAGLDRIQAIFTELQIKFNKKELHPLPLTATDIGHARGTLRYLSQARHTGKLVLTLPATADPNGTVLVTGGTGVLGALVAKHLITRHNVKHLVLASRQGADAKGAGDLQNELTALGATVTIAKCDAADSGALAELLNSIPAAHPLTGVIHAAGALDDAPLNAQTPAHLDAVFGPKVNAAWNLHQLTAQTPLAWFVMFSSLAGTLGSPGQANYAAANAALDALAQQRRAAGLPAVSLAWGYWDTATGMTGHMSQADRQRLHRTGITPMSTAHGLEMLDAALASPHSSLIPAAFSTATLTAQARNGTLPKMLSGLAAIPAAAQARTSAPDMSRQLAALPADQQQTLLVTLIRTATATVLGHSSPAAINPGATFKDLGFDSLTAIELRNHLSTATGLHLPATLIFDHPTPTALSEHMVTLITPAKPSSLDDLNRLEAAISKSDDDDLIAIVGMACRYPGGVANADDLWNLVASGTDAIGEFPADRGWDLAGLYDADPEALGKVYTQRGGFLYDAGHFDAAFFGMSPREALVADPQQRLLLEVAWEALEQAGINPASLRGTDAGVFAGVVDEHYPLNAQNAPSNLEGYFLTGTTSSVASGRVAYCLGLEGPAITVDTACSSSLVTMHLAGQALRSGDCSLALAGGVTVMATPQPFVEFSRQRGLSVDGRCKAFSGGADGTGFSEGAGFVVLERLSDARRNGHRVLAVVRGSAVNQDGASNGLTAPSGPAQQRVIRQALASAGLRPRDVDAVEAHGTGTTLGDPIEAQAVLATYGQDRGTEPLYLGSLKSNIGHAQAAAGVGGVIKMVQALRHGVLPASLHIEEPTPHVDWTAGNVKLLTEPTPWPEQNRPRRAGVSSFGISGTNAHVILEQAPPVEIAKATNTNSVIAWPVSAKSPEALNSQAARLAQWATEATEAEMAAAAQMLTAGRAQLEHRAVVLGADRDELVSGLQALAARQATSNVITGAASGSAGRTAFVFSGQGSQWTGMGRELYATVPAFAELLDEIVAHLDPHLDRPLKDIMFAEADSADAVLIHDTAYTQPALFAFETALAKLVMSWGVTPDYLIGHSLGELTAIHVAGMLSLADAATLVTSRARLMRELPAGGAMAAIGVTEAEVAAELHLYPHVSIAAINSPTSLVISGDYDQVTALTQLWRARGRKTTALRVSHAFHSPLMDPILEPLRQVAAGLTFAAPQIPIVSNLTGKLATRDELADAGYWARHARQAVRYQDGVTTLDEHGVSTYIEIGPQPTLTPATHEILHAGDADRDVVTIAAMRKDKAGQVQLLAALAQAHVHGAPVAWTDYSGTHAFTELPTYAFQRQHYWLAPAADQAVAPAAPRWEKKFWDAVDSGSAEDMATVLGLDAASAGDLQRLLPALVARRNQGNSSYQVDWKVMPDAKADRLSGTWFAIVPAAHADSAFTRGTIQAMTDGGAEVVEVLTAGNGDGTELRGRLHEALADSPAPAGVVSLLALNAHDALPLTRSLMDALAAEGVQTPVWSVANHGARAGVLSDTMLAEFPDRWAASVDLPQRLDTGTRARLRAILGHPQGDSRVIVRESGQFVRRLVQAGVASNTEQPWTPNGTVLVTDGTDGLGADVAAWLTKNGAQVTVAACDLADRDALGALLAATPVDAVVHIDSGRDSLDAVRNLDELTAELSAFVVFSPLAGLLGQGTQAEILRHAELEALVQRRSDAGRPALLAAWGSWNSAKDAEFALDILHDVKAFDGATLALGNIRWDEFDASLASGRMNLFLSEIPQVRVLMEAESALEPELSPEGLRDMDDQDRADAILSLVQSHVAAVLGQDNDEVDVDADLMDMGFTSFAAVELSSRLKEATTVPVPPGVVYDDPTISGVARYITEAFDEMVLA